jgi:hypothetical protein
MEWSSLIRSIRVHGREQSLLHPRSLMTIPIKSRVGSWKYVRIPKSLLTK